MRAEHEIDFRHERYGIFGSQLRLDFVEGPADAPVEPEHRGIDGHRARSAVAEADSCAIRIEQDEVVGHVAVDRESTVGPTPGEPHRCRGFAVAVDRRQGSAGYQLRRRGEPHGFDAVGWCGREEQRVAAQRVDVDDFDRNLDAGVREPTSG
jgi:hypothetical protein